MVTSTKPEKMVCEHKETEIPGLKRAPNDERRGLHIYAANDGSCGNAKRPRMTSLYSGRNGQFVSPDYGKACEDPKSYADHTKVKEALKSLEEISNNSNEKFGQLTWASNALAAKILREQNGWVNVDKRVGHIPGINVGDKFSSRAELLVVGLHGQHLRGIDTMKAGDGTLLAISIVESGRYANSFCSLDELIYSGAGENPNVSRNKHPRDQKLIGGNLALRNSMERKSPVRVIRHMKLCTVGNKRDSISWYVYDGLYVVDRMWRERGPYGKLVYKFKLKKITTRVPSGEKNVLLSKKCNRAVTGGICSKVKRNDGSRWIDLSRGKEKVPIPAVNTIDGENPPNFSYITEMIYPELNRRTFKTCCSCSHGCSSSIKCLCTIKNGWEQEKPFIYECGLLCKCSISCMNRVSQRGIQVQLEVFRKYGELGWAVRSLSFIPARSFVCEYVGEIFRENEAKTGPACDKYMYDIKIPGHMQPSDCDLLRASYGVQETFTIDSRHFGNVGRFVNHSSSPNLFVQYVLYDHGDKRMPHVMLFALKDINPQQELTLNYHSHKDVTG